MSFTTLMSVSGGSRVSLVTHNVDPASVRPPPRLNEAAPRASWRPPCAAPRRPGPTRRRLRRPRRLRRTASSTPRPPRCPPPPGWRTRRRSSRALCRATATTRSRTTGAPAAGAGRAARGRQRALAATAVATPHVSEGEAARPSTAPRSPADARRGRQALPHPPRALLCAPAPPPLPLSDSFCRPVDALPQPAPLRACSRLSTCHRAARLR